MLTSEDVKEFGRECGADLVGIASMDRFEGAMLLSRVFRPRQRLAAVIADAPLDPDPL